MGSRFCYAVSSVPWHGMAWHGMRPLSGLVVRRLACCSLHRATACSPSMTARAGTLAAWRPSSIIDCLRCAVPRKGRAIPPGNLSGVHHGQRTHYRRAPHRAAGQRPRIVGEPGLRSAPRGQAVHAGRRRDLAADLDLGPATLAFAGASTPQDQRAIDEVLGRVPPDAGPPGFAGAWLRHRGLDWAADLLPSFPGLAPGSLTDQPLENLP